MTKKKPVWGENFKKGTVLFTRKTKPSILNDGIIWFQSLRESAEFIASHVLIVKDENTGIESAEKGVEYCDLSKYFDDRNIQVVCREPIILSTKVAKQVISYGDKMVKKEVPYDYTGLLGFALKFSFGLDKYIPFLRKLPPFLHIPTSRVCSAAVADMYKHTDQYENANIFKKYHVARISPVTLWNEFPFKPFRFEQDS